LTPSPAPRTGPIVERLRAAGCVYAEDEARMIISAAGSTDELTAMVRRRVGGLPLEHVLGWAEFHGLRIAVEPGVFVPRRRTEFLVDQAAASLRPGAVVLDLCCGSGAVGAALVAAEPDIELHAADLDPAAVRCARRNLPRARVHQGDLFGPLPGSLRGRVDLLVLVAPYVPTGAIRLMPPEAREHEPRVALDGGADGLGVVRRGIEEAPTWLAPGGRMLTETSPDQAPLVTAALERRGMRAHVVTDEWGNPVVVGARPTARISLNPGGGP
jgi:release factor glutamine methyltransferase